MKCVPFALLYVSFFFVKSSGGYRILGVFPAPGYSHYVLGSRLMKALAEKGHDVSLIAPFKDKNPPERYREIYLEQLINQAEEMKAELLEQFSVNSPHIVLFKMNGFSHFMVNSTLADREVQRLLRNPEEKFDLVIVEQFINDGLKVFAHHYNCPVIAFSTVGAGHWVNVLVGNSAPRSYVVDFELGYEGHMNFWQRMDNLLMGLLEELNDRLFLFPKMNELVQHYYPGAPSVEKMNSNVSLVLLNSHVSTNQPVPLLPNMIEIGGFHVQPPKQLPKDLQNYLDGAKEGVVYFSMGSNFKSKDLPKETLEAMLKVFSKLKEKILWKFEEDLPGKPKNVKIEKWLPQQDILAHPNVKLFITHGGLLSTTEAIYHGIPLLGMPVFADQRLNMAKAVASGFALQTDFRDLTEESFSNILRELLSNEKYRQNAKRRSRILHDQPIKPLDSAVYWAEYVIRHQGAHHFRSAALDLAWYQYYMVDVAVFILCLVAAAVYTTLAVVRLLLRPKNRQVKRKNE